MKIRKISLLLLIILSAFSCKKEKTEASSKVENEHSIKTTESNEFKISYDVGKYVLKIEALNGETSSIRIYTEGLDNEYGEAFEVEGQVTGSYMLDLDKDGYKEFYLTISPTDDSENIDLFVLVSDENRGFSRALIREDAVLKDVNTDSIIQKDGGLKRTFRSNGDFYSYTYELIKEGTAWVLVAKKVDE